MSQERPSLEGSFKTGKSFYDFKSKPRSVFDNVPIPRPFAIQQFERPGDAFEEEARRRKHEELAQLDLKRKEEKRMSEMRKTQQRTNGFGRNRTQLNFNQVPGKQQFTYDFDGNVIVVPTQENFRRTGYKAVSNQNVVSSVVSKNQKISETPEYQLRAPDQFTNQRELPKISSGKVDSKKELKINENFSRGAGASEVYGMMNLAPGVTLQLGGNSKSNPTNKKSTGSGLEAPGESKFNMTRTEYQTMAKKKQTQGFPEELHKRDQHSNPFSKAQIEEKAQGMKKIAMALLEPKPKTGIHGKETPFDFEIESTSKSIQKEKSGKNKKESKMNIFSQKNLNFLLQDIRDEADDLPSYTPSHFVAKQEKKGVQMTENDNFNMKVVASESPAKKENIKFRQTIRAKPPIETSSSMKSYSKLIKTRNRRQPPPFSHY